MATYEEFSSALTRVREAVDAVKHAEEFVASRKPYVDDGMALDELGNAMEALGESADDLDLILSGSPAMTHQEAEGIAEMLIVIWKKGDLSLQTLLVSALQSAADAAALQARLEMAGRVAELEAEVEKLKAQICALKFEREMGGHHHA